MENKILKIGLLGTGGKLEINNGFLSYASPYANRNFNIRLSDISTVSLAPGGMGKHLIKIIGQGTELASLKMPLPWATKCQEWILANK